MVDLCELDSHDILSLFINPESIIVDKDNDMGIGCVIPRAKYY